MIARRIEDLTDGQWNLLYEYRLWRLKHGLCPTMKQIRRFAEWERMLNENPGMPHLPHLSGPEDP